MTPLSATGELLAPVLRCAHPSSRLSNYAPSLCVCHGGLGIRDTLAEVTRLLADSTAPPAHTSSGSTGAGARRPVLIVCGTGYIMPEARAFLGIAEPR